MSVKGLQLVEEQIRDISEDDIRMEMRQSKINELSLVNIEVPTPFTSSHRKERNRIYSLQAVRE